MDSVLEALAYAPIPIKSSFANNKTVKTVKTFKSIVSTRVQEQAISGFTSILAVQVTDSMDR